MGLFGLIVSVVGLGAMTKDAISDSINTSNNYNKAVENGDPYYYGSGSKMYSTKTGRQCREEYNFLTNHNVLVDAETGEIIEDLTASNNKDKTSKEMKNIMGSGCMFYKTHEFDDKKHRFHNIYKCINIPGYFTKSTSNNIDSYKKCSVVFDDFWGYQTKTENKAEEYFADGTPYTREKASELHEANVRSLEIKDGKVIFPYKDKFVEGFKDINTGELYINYEYYFPAYKTYNKYPEKRWFRNGKEYKKAKIVTGKEIGYNCKKYVLVPIEGSKRYNDHGEIVR